MIIIEKNTIKIKTGEIELEISINNRFQILSIHENTEDKLLGRQKSYLLTFDRQIIDLTKEGSCEVKTRSVEKSKRLEELILEISVPHTEGKLCIEKHIFVYSGIPAIRMYDIFSSDTDVDGIQYSEIFNIEFEKMSHKKCMNYFSCTDQSNHRLIEKENPQGKISGCFILAWENKENTFFIYREGPTPDNQPVKEEYNFFVKQNVISCVGTGFNKIKKNERRRANGVVFGLAGNIDSLELLRKYQYVRYNLDKLPVEILANSWPFFKKDINEEKIMKELELAAKCGINTVFIDDGWFSTFMGDIDREKFPNEFRKLGEFAKKNGINLGLWMNPLGLWYKHPKALIWDGSECNDAMVSEIKWNWVARTMDFIPVEARIKDNDADSYYAMDLMNEEYYQYIKDRIISFYKNYGIKRYKFDLYRLYVFDTLLGDQHQHFEKYRELIEELKKEIPELIISMDITRRSRPSFEFGLDTGRLFMENRDRVNHSITDHRYYQPWITLGNFFSLAKYIPGQKIEVEVLPQVEEYPIEYILGTGIFGTPLYWGSLTELTEERFSLMKEFFEKTEPHRKNIFRSCVMTAGEIPKKGNWSVIYSYPYDRNITNAIYIGIYRNGAESDNYVVELPILNGINKVFYDVLNTQEKFEVKKGRLEVNIKEKFGFRFLTADF